MGGRSKTSVTGYRYFFGLHMGIGRGPVDAIHEIKVGDRTAWSGSVSTNRTINIDAPNLFGGEDKEGGVQGPLEVMMGEETQEASAGLKAMLGPVLPGFRRRVTAFYNGLVAMNNPYPKAWKFRLGRTLAGWDGPVFQPALARIPLGQSVVDAATQRGIVTQYSYDDGYPTPTSTIISETMNVETLNNSVDPPVPNPMPLSMRVAYDPNNQAGVVSIRNRAVFSVYPNFIRSGKRYMEIFVPVVTVLQHRVPFGFFGFADPATKTGFNYSNTDPYAEGRWLFGRHMPDVSTIVACNIINGVRTDESTNPFGDNTVPYVVGIEADYDTSRYAVTVNGVEVFVVNNPPTVLEPIFMFDRFGPGMSSLTPPMQMRTQVNTWEYSTDPAHQPFYHLSGAVDPQYVYAMNGAHIIYECLTNREWGRGLARNKVDETSFQAAASILHGESFGLCIKWTRQDSIESFVQGILDHIGANLYQSRITGLMTLKLIRSDYGSVDLLPTFDTDSGLLEIRENTVGVIGRSVNTISVKWHDPFTDEDRTITVKNPAAILASGGVINSASKSYPGLPTSDLALRVAQRDLRAASTNLRRFTVVGDRSLDIYHPGDVIAIRDNARGIPKMAVRIGKVKDGTLTDGKITLEVIQDVFSLPTTTLAAEVPSTWTPPSTRPCFDDQAAIEAPYFMLARTMSAADLAYVRSDGGYLLAMGAKGQPMNAGVQLAVRDGAPTVEDNPPNENYFCG